MSISICIDNKSQLLVIDNDLIKKGATYLPCRYVGFNKIKLTTY